VKLLTLAASLALLIPAAMAPSAPRSQFDHLVVAVRSLDEGIAEFERLTGVKAGAGGKHPGRGTENALVSFGGGKYLEIIAPQPGATLAPRDQGMLKLDRLRIINWAISVSDVDEAVATLKGAGFAATPPQPGSRVTPAGERLEWTTFGLAGPAIAAAPFFINWSAATRHPSSTAPGGCAMPELKIADPASDRLSGALRALGVDGVTYAKGAVRIEARLTCGDRTATLTTPPL
jgi:Glyoxalase-like domain